MTVPMHAIAAMVIMKMEASRMPIKMVQMESLESVVREHSTSMKTNHTHNLYGANKANLAQGNLTTIRNHIRIVPNLTSTRSHTRIVPVLGPSLRFQRLTHIRAAPAIVLPRDDLWMIAEARRVILTLLMKTIHNQELLATQIQQRLVLTKAQGTTAP
jgi:hypothetical protein